jgi:ketosteroid isomerase-like protein
LIKFLTLVAQNVKISEFAPKKFLRDEDTVAVIGDDEAEVISTGKTYKTHWVQVFTLKNGMIIHGRVYIDTLQIAGAFQH